MHPLLSAQMVRCALCPFPLVPAFADRCRHVEARKEGRAPHSQAFALWRHLAHLPGKKDMNDLAADRFASPAVPVARAAAAARRRAEGPLRRRPVGLHDVSGAGHPQEEE